MYLSSSTATNCIFTNNNSRNGGGGAYLHYSSATNCVFTNNITEYNYGGGANLQYSSATNCIFTNNSGSNGGGGAYANGSTLNNCTAIMNKATTGDNFYVIGGQRLYNCASWGGNIYLAQANYAYKIYNCASNFALSGVTNWDTNADVHDFLALTDFPFAAPALPPWGAPGAFNTNLSKGEESLAYIKNIVMPSMPDAHLPAGSALIGAGYYEAGVTPDTDADGKARPLTPSIGAYEP